MTHDPCREFQARVNRRRGFVRRFVRFMVPLAIRAETNLMDRATKATGSGAFEQRLTAYRAARRIRKWFQLLSTV